ncbi:MAG: hypothetical protein PHN85_07670 [Kiritimatiellae bacterium]|nr:hypothetical protein [Kiritimatiellia bacterium]
MLVACLLSAKSVLFGQDDIRLEGTERLQRAAAEARSADMVAGIDRFLMREIGASEAARKDYWRRDVSSAEAYARSVAPNRARLRAILGVVAEDERAAFSALERLCTTDHDAKLAEAPGYAVHAVRWPVFRDVRGEGLLLQPEGAVRARVIVLPDADQTPEMLAGLAGGADPVSRLPLRLAAAGCEVVIPAIVSRGHEFSGSGLVKVRTDQTHREWLYRMTFTLGRHVIGYELQTVLALVDWMEMKGRADGAPIAVAGYGEGGLLALYGAAIDTRLQAALVSGYLRNRDRVWEEPLYRNVFGLLREFGDAEIASLVAPRPLVIEYSGYPLTPTNAKKPQDVRHFAAPGKLTHPPAREVAGEVQRARALTGAALDDNLRLVTGADDSPCPFFSPEAAEAFLGGLGLDASAAGEPSVPTRTDSPLPDASERQRRLVRGIQREAQSLLPVCERERQARFWDKLPLSSPGEFSAATEEFRDEFAREVIGAFADPALPLRAGSRLIAENEAFTVYDVVIDVWSDVFAWGYLTVPKGIKPGEKRPVVVCQHGLEGLPTRCTNEDRNSRDYKGYKGVASYLARQGFVTFAPHNPYRGYDKFRILQRKLNPLGKTLFSVIIAQHRRILEWLGGQHFVDPARIAFYGKSYGGKSAMRIPAVLDGYCMSICSGDFNDWIRKVVSDDYRGSYLFTGEWEISEWNLGRTFNYAEMAALIAPRPFMVERGRDDKCGLDEWIAREYAKVERLYSRLGLDDHAEIEYFNGPHAINGKGTYEFLYKHLSWQPGAPSPE